MDNVTIHFAQDGEEGLEMYQVIQPEYIFVDLLMPKCNGYELIKLIKNCDNNAKIIVVSADVQKSIKEEMKGLGVILFINKPFNAEKAKLVADIMRNGK